MKDKTYKTTQGHENTMRDAFLAASGGFLKLREKRAKMPYNQHAIRQLARIEARENNIDNSQ